MFITGYKNGTWYDKNGRPYEWHENDPLRLRDVIIWRMCQSRVRFIRRYGVRRWYGK